LYTFGRLDLLTGGYTLTLNYTYTLAIEHYLSFTQFTVRRCGLLPAGNFGNWFHAELAAESESESESESYVTTDIQSASLSWNKGGCVDLRADLDDLEKRKFLTLPGLELRPLGRPARR
jgi:hypothetical protein